AASHKLPSILMIKNQASSCRSRSPSTTKASPALRKHHSGSGSKHLIAGGKLIEEFVVHKHGTVPTNHLPAGLQTHRTDSTFSDSPAGHRTPEKQLRFSQSCNLPPAPKLFPQPH